MFRVIVKPVVLCTCILLSFFSSAQTPSIELSLAFKKGCEAGAVNGVPIIRLVAGELQRIQSLAQTDRSKADVDQKHLYESVLTWIRDFEDKSYLTEKEEKRGKDLRDEVFQASFFLAHRIGTKEGIYRALINPGQSIVSYQRYAELECLSKQPKF